MNVLTPPEVREIDQNIRTELGKVIVGQDEIVRLLLASLFARGHCLLVGVPGLAKTLLVKSLAEVLQLEFKRVQFTPDLMPSDILGSELLQEKERRLEFEYQPGPIFTNLLLADEINRTPPKTQSALLEAMQERRVTVGHDTRPLPDPFLVIATQNPIEQEGTYPLPEAQIDRFMFSLTLGYPTRTEEAEIVRRTTLQAPVSLSPVATREQILAIQALVRAAPVSDHVIEYAVALAAATRPRETDALALARDYLEWGAGPRAAQCLVLGAKALALLDGRLAPETADVRAVAAAVLPHRVVVNYRATGAGRKAPDIVAELTKAVREKTY
jgi:MoxR-like ATPase